MCVKALTEHNLIDQIDFTYTFARGIFNLRWRDEIEIRETMYLDINHRVRPHGPWKGEEASISSIADPMNCLWNQERKQQCIATLLSHRISYYQLCRREGRFSFPGSVGISAPMYIFNRLVSEALATRPSSYLSGCGQSSLIVKERDQGLTADAFKVATKVSTFCVVGCSHERYGIRQAKTIRNSRRSVGLGSCCDSST
jgi:hypothetical protein